ncbi:MAG: 16S rRNA (guanine(527)-N(7))-methyltransferase RsmG [Anaerolineales bacterium]|nr:16S rRNA (guanine(527)-N(7))-methyltransferase RsmG [Anaerolineales bacterium]
MDKLAAAAKMLGIELTPAQLDAFDLYRRELKDWNTRINLTAIDTDEGIRIRHFLDSLSCLLALRLSLPNRSQADTRLIDVGSGAGFPGIPLKIVCPNIHLTLLEATGKKVSFLEYLCDQLKLKGVRAVQGRAESAGQDPIHREQYDWALARSVAEMPILAEYLLPLVRNGGYCLAQKGENAPAEVRGAEKAIAMLGGRLDRIMPVELHGLAETRYLVLVRKIAPTPGKYPRRPGMPSKRPIR